MLLSWTHQLTFLAISTAGVGSFSPSNGLTRFYIVLGIILFVPCALFALLSLWKLLQWSPSQAKVHSLFSLFVCRPRFASPFFLIFFSWMSPHSELIADWRRWSTRCTCAS